MLDAITAGPASSKQLAPICDRVAMSLDAGIDIRRVWRSEASRSRGRAAAACDEVARAVESGQSLDAAIAGATPFFPPLFVELVRIGEATGTTTETFRRLAEHYQRQVTRVRAFRSAITWPAIQLSIALFVVGVMIAVGGVLDDGRGEPIDLLGLGLVGERGLMVYVSCLCGLALIAALTASAFRRAPTLRDALRGAATGLPVVGPVLRNIAVGRVAWALHLVMNTEVDVRRVVEIVLRASGNRRFTRHSQHVIAGVDRGEPLSACFARTDEFPQEFLDALRVGEEGGLIVETMDRISKQYDEHAERDLETMTTIAALAVWLAVAALIITVIFRVFGFYRGMIDGALEGL